MIERVQEMFLEELDIFLSLDFKGRLSRLKKSFFRLSRGQMTKLRYG